METNWAAEHLQVIRTLMERSALYRRTLAPIMMVNGTIGVAAAIIGWRIPIESNRAFAIYWICISLLAIITTFLLARRQALKEDEPFWSLPTRRIAQALLPTFIAGLCAGGVFMIVEAQGTWLLAVVWVIVYGFSLHGAGFFMQRGIKLLGWGFILSGCGLLYASILLPDLQTTPLGHAIMGGLFGFVQLAYSLYLYFTEKTKQVA